MKDKYFTPWTWCNWACHSLQHHTSFATHSRWSDDQVFLSLIIATYSSSFVRSLDTPNKQLLTILSYSLKGVKIWISILLLWVLLCFPALPTYMCLSFPSSSSSCPLSSNKWRSPCHWTEVGLWRSGGGSKGWRVKAEIWPEEIQSDG